MPRTARACAGGVCCHVLNHGNRRADCNANGFPDSCDIATEISEDANENGVPDECEEEQMMMGAGGSEDSTGETPVPPSDPTLTLPSPWEGEGIRMAARSRCGAWPTR